MPYRHFLLATDGSRRSRRTIRVAVQLARSMGARVTALYVTPAGVPTIFSGDTLYGTGVLGGEYRKAVHRREQAALATVEQAALAAGVRFSSAHALRDAPWKAVVGAARARRCDLIVMGSHGMNALAALGSQALRTIAHTHVPVLVVR